MCNLLWDDLKVNGDTQENISFIDDYDYGTISAEYIDNVFIIYLSQSNQGYYEQIESVHCFFIII